MKIINLFGGPCCGKSTTALELCAAMKKAGYKVEIVLEYAKDLTYGKDDVKLGDQVHILGEQHHRIWKLKGQVDYIVTDSPFVGGIPYIQEDGHFNKDNLERLTVDLFNSYDNFNVMLRRGGISFQSYGRKGTLNDALIKDQEIVQLLNVNKIPFDNIGTVDAVDFIMKSLPNK